MDDALRVIRTFVNNFDAEVARSALEAAGIDAMIRSDEGSERRAMTSE